MTAIIDPIRPFHPPYYHREYPNDVGRVQKQPPSIYKRVALVAVPFFGLCNPLSFPLSLGLGATRVYTAATQWMKDLQTGDGKQISWSTLQTTIAVIALASTVFAHPLGMIVTTSQDILFELSDFVQCLHQGNFEAAFVALTKIVNNALYLVLMCQGGRVLAIASFAMQAVALTVSSRDEFRKGNLLEACGNLLMAAVRVNQGHSQFKILQRQWEIQDIVKRITVGELHERWQFPSDHLPVGIEVDGVKIISWNVLNDAYMDWVTTRDSQGLKGSMISDLDTAVAPNGLTQRDLLVADMVTSMTSSGDVVALQECGDPFLEALREKLPAHWEMVKSFHAPRTDQGVLLFDKSRLTYHADHSGMTRDAYPSVPGRPLQYALFSKPEGRALRIINAHIPGDPALPAKEEFAKYVGAMHRQTQTTVALGDNNFEREEMISAYENMGFSEFSLHSPWKTNIDPDGKYSKAIDHFFVAGGNYSRDLTPEEVLHNGNLRETIALLNGA